MCARKRESGCARAHFRIRSTWILKNTLCVCYVQFRYMYIYVTILNYRLIFNLLKLRLFVLRHWNRSIVNSFLWYILYKYYFDTTATLLNLYNYLESMDRGACCDMRERERASYIPSSIANRPANYFHLDTARSSQCLHITPRTEWPTDVIKAPHEERAIFPHNSISDHDRDWHNNPQQHFAFSARAYFYKWKNAC